MKACTRLSGGVFYCLLAAWLLFFASDFTHTPVWAHLARILVSFALGFSGVLFLYLTSPPRK